jgi:hypothetical protein
MNVLTARILVAVATCACVAAVAVGANAATPPAQTKAAIRHAWTTFFNGSLPPAKRIGMLQNGQRFAALIKAQSTSPVAKQTTATVAGVTLVGPTRAKVVYTILVSSVPMLKNATGFAVRVGSAWKVSTQTFCQLQLLQGQMPPGC